MKPINFEKNASDFIVDRRFVKDKSNREQVFWQL
jgi:hypothetical protein